MRTVTRQIFWDGGSNISFTLLNFYALWGRRRTGSPLAGIGNGSTIIFSSGNSLSHLNLLITLCMNTSISNRAYSFPGHILGPPPNGTYVYGAGPFPSNLSGSNFSGSGKHSLFLCVEFTFQCN